MYSENSKGINSTIMRGSIRELNTYAVFFQYFGTGTGALRMGKISDKTRIFGNFSFQ